MSDTFHDYLIGFSIELTPEKQDALGKLLAQFVRENGGGELSGVVIWGERSSEARYVK